LCDSAHTIDQLRDIFCVPEYINSGKNMKNLKLAPVFMLLMFMLSACNTMEGAGEDIQSAGEELEDAANKNK